MLAAEAAFAALLDSLAQPASSQPSAKLLHEYPRKVNESWIRTELYPVRNFHQGFESGFVEGMANTALLMASGGYGLRNRYRAHAGHEHMLPRWDIMGYGGDRSALIGAASGDGKLTFDKLTSVYHSGTRHEEDQPSHLVILDTDICNGRCRSEYGNPCQFFCPANVYEMEEVAGEPGKQRLRLNPSNCVHCKTCDIMDPYQIINWVPPEGEGGPNYEGM